MATVNVERLILPACELQAGDMVTEYNGAVVASARESHSYDGVTEVAFENHSGVYFLFFMTYVHVTRPVNPSAEHVDDPGDDGDEDDEGPWHDEAPATYDEGDDRW